MLNSMPHLNTGLVGSVAPGFARGRSTDESAFALHRGVTVCDRTPVFADQPWLNTTNGIAKYPSQRERST